MFSLYPNDCCIKAYLQRGNYLKWVTHITTIVGNYSWRCKGSHYPACYTCNGILAAASTSTISQLTLNNLHTYIHTCLHLDTSHPPSFSGLEARGPKLSGAFWLVGNSWRLILFSLACELLPTGIRPLFSNDTPPICNGIGKVRVTTTRPPYCQ